jgi:hypothetical protein
LPSSNSYDLVALVEELACTGARLGRSEHVERALRHLDDRYHRARAIVRLARIYASTQGFAEAERLADELHEERSDVTISIFLGAVDAGDRPAAERYFEGLDSPVQRAWALAEAIPTTLKIHESWAANQLDQLQELLTDGVRFRVAGPLVDAARAARQLGKGALAVSLASHSLLNDPTAESVRLAIELEPSTAAAVVHALREIQLM